MNDSVNVRGQLGVASLPVSRSISTKVIPSRRLELRAGRPATASFMNSVQIGSAACEPVSADRRVVVEAHPDDGQQLRREADEPGVAQIVGGAALAGGIGREAHRARGGAGALVDDAAHHVGDEERGIGTRDLRVFRRCRSQLALAGLDVFSPLSGRTNPPLVKRV